MHLNATCIAFPAYCTVLLIFTGNWNDRYMLFKKLLKSWQRNTKNVPKYTLTKGKESKNAKEDDEEK